MSEKPFSNQSDLFNQINGILQTLLDHVIAGVKIDGEWAKFNL